MNRNSRLLLAGVLTFFNDPGHPFDNCRIGMGEERALFFIQRRDLVHIFFRQCEIKYVEIFHHAFVMGGFRDHDDAALNEPAQHDLSGALAVLHPDFSDRCVFEQASAAFSEGRPGFLQDIIFFHDFMGGLLLIEHMGFHLIDHRLDAGEQCEIDKSVRIEVRYADRTYLSFIIQLFQRPPGAVIIGKRLVRDQDNLSSAFSLIQ